MAPSTDGMDRAGIHAVGAIFTAMGWAFREQPTSDFGIDAQAEKLNEGGVGGGRLIALQIKTGKSYFRKRGDGYIFYGEERHRDYWTNHSLPVFVILHDPESGLTLWQRVEGHLIEEGSNGRWALPIPAEQTLDQAHERFILEGISTDPNSIRRHQLALDLPLIRRFSDEDEVYLRVEDWVNKTLNFRSTNVVFSEEPDDEADLTLNTWLPAYTIGTFMSVHFPWLSWEEHEYLDASEGGGEVAVHVLKVELSEIGRAALTLEDYYSSGVSVDEPKEPIDIDLSVEGDSYFDEP